MAHALRAVLLMSAVLALTSCSGDHKSAQRLPSTPCGTFDGRGCAPARERVDLTTPTFSHPTRITNPLFPIARLRSAVLLGHEGAKPFRSETTLLPVTDTIMWNGRHVETLVSQYVAYADGRLEEVARDRYAQADDGSVWYFGEDVMDYKQGTVALTEGTWLAGREGPASMIMPAHPKVGDVFRLENIPGVVFEEVRLGEVGKTVHAAAGPVSEAILADELHSDGSFDHKIYAPGYGEFRTTGSGDLEALAVAVPADALPGPAPAELDALSTNAIGILEVARLGDWEGVPTILRRMQAEWKTLAAGEPPPLVASRMKEALRRLARGVKTRKVERVAQPALDVARSTIDLLLRYRSPVEIDAARFRLWTQQLRVDAAAQDLAGVTGDVAALEWIRDRFASALPASARADFDNRLRDLRAAVDVKNLRAAADHAARLSSRLRILGLA
jgi:hypothetical protein